MKRSAIALVLLCATLGVLAAVAMAHTKVYSGKTTLNNGGPAVGLSGNLSSSLAACEKNRQVTVYVVGADGTLGSAAPAETNGNGYWKTGPGFFDAAGEYVAKIPAERLVKNEQHSHKCKAVSKRRNF